MACRPPAALPPAVSRPSRCWRGRPCSRVLDGGYFDRARDWSRPSSSWLLVADAPPWRRRCRCRAARRRSRSAGLAALLALTLRLARVGAARRRRLDDAERALLYLGALIAAVALLRDARRGARPVPALAAGDRVVRRGLSGRLLPGLVDARASPAAGGRLDQPLGYWNAMGALAAVGSCCAPGWRATDRPALAARGLPRQPRRSRRGLALSFSRGAILAAVVSLGWCPSSPGRAPPAPPRSRSPRPPSRAWSPSRCPRSPTWRRRAAAPRGRRPRGRRWRRAPRRGRRTLAGGEVAEEDSAARARRLPSPPRLLAIAVALVTVVAVGALVAVESGPPAETPPSGPGRAARSVQSNRYAYWHVAAAPGPTTRRWRRRERVRGRVAARRTSPRVRPRRPFAAARDRRRAGARRPARAPLLVPASRRHRPPAPARARGRRRRLGRPGGLERARSAGLGWEMPSVTLVALLLAAAVVAAGEERQSAGDPRSDRSAEPTATTAAMA